MVISDMEQNNVAQVIENIDTYIYETDLQSLLFNFDNALFNSGKYFFNVAILRGDKGEIIASLFNTAHFVVDNHISGYSGIILKPSSIKHNDKIS